MREPRTSCPSCGGASRFWVKKAGRDVHRCPACRLIWVPAGLVVDERGASIYEGEQPIFLEEGNVHYYLDETNFLSCERKLAWVRRFVPDGACLLDAGANFGHFLKVAQPHYRAVGVELSAAAVAWSRTNLGVENHAASIYELPSSVSGPYDAITCWDVIEHVPDAEEALRKLAGVLKPGGVLMLSTPDAGSAVARLMGRYWHYLDPVQHILLFNRRNLEQRLAAAGLKLIASTTFGHVYRVRYVADRLAYLHRDGVLGRLMPVLGTMLRPIDGRKVHINLGDVMALAARKV